MTDPGLFSLPDGSLSEHSYDLPHEPIGWSEVDGFAPSHQDLANAAFEK